MLYTRCEAVGSKMYTVMNRMIVVPRGTCTLPCIPGVPASISTVTTTGYATHEDLIATRNTRDRRIFQLTTRLPRVRLRLPQQELARQILG